MTVNYCVKGMALVVPVDSILVPSDGWPSRSDVFLAKHHPFNPVARPAAALTSELLLPHRLSFCSPAHRAPKWTSPAASGNADASSSSSSAGGDGDSGRSSRGDDDEHDIDQALHLDGQIPPTSDGFLKQVSSRAYDMRRRLEQSIDTSSYDVLEANPWREDSKPVYVLAQEENKLLTMRTRRARSEVANELSLLFPKRGSRRGASAYSRTSSQSTKSTNETRFQMVVEDVREGVLVFEDEEEATKYCSLLDGQGKSCMGVAELEASDVFNLCKNIRAFAVLFRRGRTPPLPENLQLNLKARKHSLED